MVKSGDSTLSPPRAESSASSGRETTICLVPPRTRSSAQGNCSAKSLAGNVTCSSLFSLSSRGGGSRGGGSGQREEVGGGGWGYGGGCRGHFIHLAMYCTTTWCFALKGLRTINMRLSRAQTAAQRNNVLIVPRAALGEPRITPDPG